MKQAAYLTLFYMAAMLVFIFLLATACGTVTRPDTSPPYSEENYRSAEMSLCGKYFFGVGGCDYPTGASTKTNLGIQGYYTGEISVFSDLCRVDWKQRYGMNEFVTVSLAELLGTPTLSRTQSCTLKVIVSPDPIKGSEESVSPRVGEVYVEVRLPGVAALNFPTPADQVRESELGKDLVIRVPQSERGQYLLSRCGEPSLTGDFSESILLPDFSRKASCKYQLAVKTESGKKYSSVFYRNVFSRNTILLARPKITRTKDEICIEADPSSTTFLSIDNAWANKTKLCAKGKGPFKVRVFTTRRNSFEVVR